MAGLIGLDLDNTLISYDDALARVAVREGFAPADFRGGKASVRRLVRDNPRHGLPAWQYLQGIVYGPGIDAAELYPGVLEFCRAALAAGYALRIFSHKTRYAVVDATRTDMRRAALTFLEARGLTRYIPATDIGFYDDLTLKVRAIAAAACAAFVDDLPEVFHHQDFPKETRKMLFVPHETPDDAGRLSTYRDWPEIARALLPQGARA